MKIQKIYLLLILIMLSSHNVYSQGVKTFSCNSAKISVATDVPPAIIYFEDEQGNISGANPSNPVDVNGQQDKGVLLMNIPNSFADQSNTAIEDENTGTVTGQDHTLYEITICNGDENTYALHIKGVISGISYIYLTCINRPKKLIMNDFNVLVEPDKERIVYVSYNPSTNILDIKREVSGEDLLSDINVACNKELIHKSECIYYRVLVGNIVKAINDNNDRLAKKLLMEFIDKLKKPRKHQKDEEDIYSMLREDALSLLADLDGGICHYDKKKKERHLFKHGWKDRDMDK